MAREYAATPSQLHHQDKLQCPTCNKKMESFQQLNQHLDGEHMQLGPDAHLTDPRSSSRSDDVSPKPWLKLFAKDAQSQEKEPPVTHEHWEHDIAVQCRYGGCNHSANVHCRQCGRLFCRTHASLRKRLASDASPDPFHGVWCRVCITCFETKPGFSDTGGVTVDKTAAFNRLRTPALDRKMIRRDRLEKRLVRLISGLASLDKQVGGLWAWGDTKRQREFEQREIVAWEDEKPHERCRFCGQRFSYFNRKHHCRVCGLVVCGDLERDCSREVATVIIAEKLGRNDLIQSSTYYPVRICVECRNTIFSHRTFLEEKQAPLPYILALNTQLKQLQYTIDVQLPKFQDLVASLLGEDVSPQQQTQIHPDPAVLAATKHARSILLQTFTRYESMARKLRLADVATESERRIQAQISTQAAQYLQMTMLPLQALPQVLHNYSTSGTDVSYTPEINKDEAHRLQNTLIILEEQRYLLQNRLVEAKNNRHFDEIPPLEASVTELGGEINDIREKLGNLGPSL